MPEDAAGEKNCRLHRAAFHGAGLRTPDLQRKPARHDVAVWHLPDYMIPAAFVLLDALAADARNGKIDRKALPCPERKDAAVSKSAFVAPVTPQGRRCRTWAEVLGVEAVGTQDDIFDLGGNSLHILQIAARANGRDCKITTSQIFALPSHFRSAARPAEEIADNNGDESTMPPMMRIERNLVRRSA